MQTNQAQQHSQPRSWMTSAVLSVLFVSLLAAALRPKEHDPQNRTTAQPVSAQEPYAARHNPAPASVKDIVKHKTGTHRQYALQQATHAHESGVS